MSLYSAVGTEGPDDNVRPDVTPGAAVEMQQLDVSPLHADDAPGIAAPPADRRAALRWRRQALLDEAQSITKELGDDGGGDPTLAEAAPAAGPLDAYFAQSTRSLMRERLPWLCGLLLLQSCAALVMGGFEASNDVARKDLVA